MSLSLNQVILAGNLTRDPETRSLPEGRMVVHFTLANNRRWKGADGTLHEEANFVDCEAWSRTAELVAQYLTKGSACVVLGRLKQDSWTDKDGGKRSKLKVVAETVQFVGGRKDEGGGASNDADSGDEAPAMAETRRAPARQASQPARAAGRVGGGTMVDEPPF